MCVDLMHRLRGGPAVLDTLRDGTEGSLTASASGCFSAAILSDCPSERRYPTVFWLLGSRSRDHARSSPVRLGGLVWSRSPGTTLSTPREVLGRRQAPRAADKAAPLEGAQGAHRLRGPRIIYCHKMGSPRLLSAACQQTGGAKSGDGVYWHTPMIDNRPPVVKGLSA